MVIVVMVTRLYPECAPAKREFVDITGKADINQANLMIAIYTNEASSKHCRVLDVLT